MSVDLNYFSFYNGFLFQANSNEDMEELFQVVEDSGLVKIDEVDELYIDLELEIIPALLEEMERTKSSEDGPILVSDPYILNDPDAAKADNDIYNSINRILDSSDLLQSFQRGSKNISKRELYEFLKKFWLDAD